MAASASRPLRFGVQLQAQRTSWNAYLDAVHAVERLGFDTLWNFDHMLPFSGPDDGPAFDTWTTLAAMAMATNRIGVGALVNGVLYRDPATLAKSAAQVDIISNGRLQFALGAAWAEREFRTYGLPFPPVRERLDRLDEALDLITRLWTQPRTTYHGRYYHVENAPLEPKPVQQPYPHIMVGGSGRRTARIAARYADEWNGIGSPEQCAERIGWIREECAAIGRDPGEIEFSTHPLLAIAHTRDEAEAKARAIAASHAQSVDDEPDRWLIGTPPEVVAQLRSYVDVGITHWVMGVGAPFDIDALQLFADEVIPALR